MTFADMATLGLRNIILSTSFSIWAFFHSHGIRVLEANNHWAFCNRKNYMWNGCIESIWGCITSNSQRHQWIIVCDPLAIQTSVLVSLNNLSTLCRPTPCGFCLLHLMYWPEQGWQVGKETFIKIQQTYNLTSAMLGGVGALIIAFPLLWVALYDNLIARLCHWSLQGFTFCQLHCSSASIQPVHYLPQECQKLCYCRHWNQCIRQHRAQADYIVQPSQNMVHRKLAWRIFHPPMYSS